LEARERILTGSLVAGGRMLTGNKVAERRSTDRKEGNWREEC
jgi:hypothetical protein